MGIGCATGGTNPGDAGGRPSADAGPRPCSPPCTGDAECISGRCVNPEDDRDNDGIPSDVDCDDRDPSAGSNLERLCSSDCGGGVERCTDGVWEPCSAPTTCDCTEGEAPRTIDCARCGTQRQICARGRWTDDGECNSGACTPGEMRMLGPCGACGTEVEVCGSDCRWGAAMCVGEGGSCLPGEMGSEQRDCGACGRGMQERTRSCSATCEWGSWNAWSTCSAPGSSECTPGEEDTATTTVGCTGGATRSRTRTCSTSTCSWGSWGAWSSCSGGTPRECTPGATRDCAGREGSRYSSGTSCVQQVCGSDGNWQPCGLRPGNQCDWISDGGSGGSRWQCCAPGSWQFCLPSCRWSSGCEMCSGCGC